MPNQKAVAFVKQALQKGVHIEVIESKLRAAGWPEDEISSALALAMPSQVEKTRSHTLVLSLLIILFLALTLAIAIFYFSASHVDASLSSAKLIYHLNEPFAPVSVEIRSQGPALLAVYYFQANLFESGSLISKNPESALITRDTNTTLGAFSISDDSLFFLTGSFQKRGIYTYFLSIYSCKDVERLGKGQCGTVDPLLTAALEPALHKNISIIVLAGNISV